MHFVGLFRLQCIISCAIVCFNNFVFLCRKILARQTIFQNGREVLFNIIWCNHVVVIVVVISGFTHNCGADGVLVIAIVVI